MTKEMDPIPLSEFTENPINFFEQISRDSKEILIENEKGEQFVLKQVPTSTRRKQPHTEADWQAFLAAAGGWKDVDTDKLIHDIYESREMGSRIRTEADRQAFLASLGSWKDEDVDQFLKNNEESRNLNIRPPVDLD